MFDRSGESSLEDNDLRLLEKAGQGDAPAFSRLVERHGPGLLRLAYSLLGNQQDAEDVLQETFLGAFRGVNQFQKRSSVRTWLGQILVRQAALWRRKNQRHPRLRLELGASSQAQPGQYGSGLEDKSASQASARVDNRLDLHERLQQLTPEHREILVLREFEQLSYEEMAATLGVPRGTVESRLNRARNELRELLKGNEEPFGGGTKAGGERDLL